MAKKLGYGGIANTNGARDFTGKTPAAPAAQAKPLVNAIRLGSKLKGLVS